MPVIRRQESLGSSGLLPQASRPTRSSDGTGGMIPQRLARAKLVGAWYPAPSRAVERLCETGRQELRHLRRAIASLDTTPSPFGRAVGRGRGSALYRCAVDPRQRLHRCRRQLPPARRRQRGARACHPRGAEVRCGYRRRAAGPALFRAAVSRLRRRHLGALRTIQPQLRGAPAGSSAVASRSTISFRTNRPAGAAAGVLPARSPCPARSVGHTRRFGASR